MRDRFVGLDVADATGHGAALRGSPRARVAAVVMALLAAALLALVLPSFAHAEGEEAPSVLNQGATGVSKTSAILNALVNPNGAVIEECEFEYGTSPTALTQTAQCAEPFPEPGENFQQVSAAIGGLIESTKYYFRIAAVSVFGESVGSPVKAFTTLPTHPGVTTSDATGISRTSATLHGLVNPNLKNVTRCEFLVSTTQNFSEMVSHASCQVLPGAGEKQVKVTAQANGLVEHQGYFYRLVAENELGEELGAVLHFKTPPTKPKTETQKYSELTRHSVQLNGIVNPEGSEIEACEFEYGPTIAFGSSVPCASPPKGTGESYLPVSAELKGLPEGATYYYRVVAKNFYGESFGNHRKFTTYPTSPAVVTMGATHLTAEGAQLNATVNPGSKEVMSCEFEWGPNIGYGHHLPCSMGPGSGESPVAVSATLTGVSGSTTYDFRIVATNSLGTSFGGNVKFTTEAGGQKPEITKLGGKSCLTTGAKNITITGLGFTAATEVLFGSDPATKFSVKNGTHIVAECPPEPVGKVPVRVTTPVGTSPLVPADEFTYKEKH